MRQKRPTHWHSSSCYRIWDRTNILLLCFETERCAVHLILHPHGSHWTHGVSIVRSVQMAQGAKYAIIYNWIIYWRRSGVLSKVHFILLNVRSAMIETLRRFLSKFFDQRRMWTEFDQSVILGTYLAPNNQFFRWTNPEFVGWLNIIIHTIRMHTLSM